MDNLSKRNNSEHKKKQHFSFSLKMLLFVLLLLNVGYWLYQKHQQYQRLLEFQQLLKKRFIYFQIQNALNISKIEYRTLDLEDALMPYLQDFKNLATLCLDDNITDKGMSYLKNLRKLWYCSRVLWKS